VAQHRQINTSKYLHFVYVTDAVFKMNEIEIEIEIDWLVNLLIHSKFHKSASQHTHTRKLYV
jgi:hypothetical protein